MDAKLESGVISQPDARRRVRRRGRRRARPGARARVEASSRPRDAAFLGPAHKREIIYRLLTGRSGHLFQRNVMFDRRALGVGKAIHWLKENFDRPPEASTISPSAQRMSVSSLHHKFKAVTTMGPLQYQKRLRLEEARRRLLGGAVDATGAAFAVGYESPSQFSREYRRLFGLPPSKDAKVGRPKNEPLLWKKRGQHEERSRPTTSMGSSSCLMVARRWTPSTRRPARSSGASPSATPKTRTGRSPRPSAPSSAFRRRPRRSASRS